MKTRTTETLLRRSILLQATIQEITDPYTFRGLALWALGIAIPYVGAILIMTK